MFGMTDEMFKNIVDKIMLNQSMVKSYRVEGFKVTVEYISNSGKSTWEAYLYFSDKDGGGYQVSKPNASYTAPDFLARDLFNVLKNYSA